MSPRKKVGRKSRKPLSVSARSDSLPRFFEEGVTLESLDQQRRSLMLVLMLDAYGIPRDDTDRWFLLAASLAMELVPGFRNASESKRRVGRPRKNQGAFLPPKIAPAKNKTPGPFRLWTDDSYQDLLQLRHQGEIYLRTKSPTTRITDQSALMEGLARDERFKGMSAHERRRFANALAKRLPDARKFVRNFHKNPPE